MIAGLSQGVLVFEPGSLGGTLNTGLTTLALKIPLFAAVYQKTPPTAVGHRLLLARGACPVEMDRETATRQVDKMIEIMSPGNDLASCA